MTIEEGTKTLASVAALACTAILALASSQVWAGISNTRHNLSTGAAAGQNRVTAGTDEICVFCHTPHAADTSAPVPLWNKALPASGGFTTYANLNSSTIDGEILTVGSVSLACLSCHDGTQAMDNIINAPGFGGYDATGGGALGRSYTWDTTTGRVDADGLLLNNGEFIANLTKDVSDDHPIGIQYCGGGPNASAPGAACVDADFVAPDSATINTNLVWWVNAGTGPATRDKGDMILYTRTFTGNDGPSVECASCHDPHAEQGVGQAGATFLRVANTGSAVCLSCHVK